MGWTDTIRDVGANAADPLNLTGYKGMQAKKDYQDTMDQAMGGIPSAYREAKGNINTGYANARGQYNNNQGVIASRKELYNRVMGKGGYTPETVNQMKGNAIEQGGTQMRNASTALQDRYGDAQGGGMTGENLARAYATIGANQSNALRDVDINQAQLQHQDQTNAMPMIYQDAGTMAGLDTGEAGALAGLTTEQAKAIAELMSAKASGSASLAMRPNGIQSLLGGG